MSCFFLKERWRDFFIFMMKMTLKFLQKMQWQSWGQDIIPLLLTTEFNFARYSLYLISQYIKIFIFLLIVISRSRHQSGSRQQAAYLHLLFSFRTNPLNLKKISPKNFISTYPWSFLILAPSFQQDWWELQRVFQSTCQSPKQKNEQMLPFLSTI